MFPVEILLEEERLAQTMESMRTWLDHQRLEPATFGYTFAPGGLVVRVDFAVETEASAFATAFTGRVVAVR